jgi:hypothetical protein
VWLQLLERCAAEPNCQPTALRSLAQQLAEQRELTLHLQHQVSQQQQQIAGFQGELRELRAAVQQLLPLRQE